MKKVVFFSQHLTSVLRKIAYSSLIVLCVVNICFFCTHWYDIQITLSTEAILLSVVGFFFAFAGINIYSIFNTNVETEKQQIRDLAERYRTILEQDAMLLKFPKELIKIYHNCLYLTSTDSFQIYSFDCMTTLENLLKSQHVFIQSLKDSNKIDAFDQCVTDSREMAKSMSSLLKKHQKDIKYNGFFRGHPSEEKNYMSRLEMLIKTVNEVLYDNYEHDELSEENKKSVVEKFFDVCQYARKVFNI